MHDDAEFESFVIGHLLNRLKMDEYGWEVFHPEPSEAETLLSWAIMEGDLSATLSAACSLELDLNETMSEHTPLTLTSHLGHAHIVTALLDQFKETIDVNGKTLNGLTPLLAAANAGHAHVCRILVEKGADVNQRGDGSYPLHNAIHFKHAETAMTLLSLDADPQVCDREGWHPLYYAATNGMIPLCEELLNRGCDVDFGRFVGGNEGSFYPLLSAIFQGHCATAIFLIERGADVTLFDRTGRDALCYAGSGGHIDLLKLLLEKGAKANLSRKTDTIHEVVHEAEAVEVLLDAGVDVDQLDGLGRTPLYLAAGGGCRETCEVLIRHGAAVNSIRSYCTGSMMSSPLLKALNEGHCEVLELLLDFGADPDFGRNCLLHALSLQHLDICEALLKRKVVSPNIADSDGNSALHVSTLHCGFEAGTLLLLRHGADPNVINVFQQRPLEIAIQGRQWRAVAAMLMAGARINDGVRGKLAVDWLAKAVEEKESDEVNVGDEDETMKRKKKEKEKETNLEEKEEKEKELKRRRSACQDWCCSYLNGPPLPLIELTRISIRCHLALSLADRKGQPDWHHLPPKLENYIFLENEEF